VTDTPIPVPKNRDRSFKALRDGTYDLREGSAKGLLDPRSRRAQFIREYLVDLSPKHAAIRAGYGIDKADETAALLMKMPHIRDGIQRALASRSRRTGVNADRVLDRLGAMAFSDPRAVFNEDGSLKAPHEIAEQDAFMIAGVKTRRIVELNPDTGKMHNAEIQEVKLIDRTSVLALLMRHLGMMNDKISIDVHGSLAEQLEAARLAREGGDAVVRDDGTLTAAQIAEIEDEERTLDGEIVEDEPDMSDEARALLGF
jgi:phage terminase small subunit